MTLLTITNDHGYGKFVYNMSKMSRANNSKYMHCLYDLAVSK